MSRKDAYLVVGLGNPGPQYLGTRHNVGHLVIDHLASLAGLLPGAPYPGKISEARINGLELSLLKPAAYVNTSGPAVKKITVEHGINITNVIAVHDDLDLDLAALKVKQGGSSGGHRGIDSLIKAFDSDQFARVRIGIGRPPGRMEPAEFVLKPFSAAERAQIDVTAADAAGAVLTVVKDGIEAAMNAYNIKKQL